MTEEQAEYKTGPASLFASAARQEPVLTVEEMLDELHTTNIEISALNRTKAEAILIATPVEVQDAIAEVETRYIMWIEDAKARAAMLTAEIEARVLQDMSSVQGKTMNEEGRRLTAIYNKGRAGAWDSKKLEGYALVHPEIMAARKPDGKPYVTFREC